MGRYLRDATPDEIRRSKRRAADKARRERKKRELEEAHRIARIVRAMTGAAWEAYADHERSTSDPYLKKRIHNAVYQVATRAINELFPEWVATVGDKESWKVKEWDVTVDDVVRVKETIGAPLVWHDKAPKKEGT